jgi:putative hydroxymethylpyrimidine transport system substrate-binding protein
VAGRLCDRATAAACALVAALALAACGADDDRGAPATIDVALDFTPNAVHAPLYAAVREKLDEREGVRVRIRPPGSGPDGLKLVASGRADVGLLDIHDLGLALERGSDVVGIAALVQRPLAAVVAVGDVRRPRDLEGRRVGVSGLPSDPAVLRAVLEHDGASLARVKQVTIGFNSVSNLVAGKVAAVPVFWNVEGVALRKRGVKTHEFRVDDYGAPRYPEVVLFTSRATLARRRDDLRALLRALGAGVDAALADPAAAAAEVARAGDADTDLVRAQLAAVGPAFRPALRLDRARLEEWADFDVRFGVLRKRPDVARAFDFGMAP